MKKYILTFAFILIFLLAGCGLETKTIPQFYEKDLGDVTKIVIVDGNTGNEKTITDKAVVDDFLNEIKDIKFIPEQDQREKDGFKYSIALFQDNEDSFVFSLTGVNRNNYHTEPDIYPIVDEFYKNLKVEEE